MYVVKMQLNCSEVQKLNGFNKAQYTNTRKDRETI